MKTFKIKVFDAAGVSKSRWQKLQDDANKLTRPHGYECELHVVKSRYSTPVFSEHKDTKTRPGRDYYWLNKNVFKTRYTFNARDFSHVVAYFSEKQWLKPRPDNDLRGQSIDKNFGVSENAFCGSFTKLDRRPVNPQGKKINQVLRRFIHEVYGHSMWDHILERPQDDKTHEWDYDKTNLLGMLEDHGKHFDTSQPEYKVVVDLLPNSKSYSSNQVKAVVFHVDLGTFNGTEGEVKGPRSVSYHEYIRRDKREIRQWVKPTRGAWHTSNRSWNTGKHKDLFGDHYINQQSYGMCYSGRPVDKNGKVPTRKNSDGVVVIDWSKVVDGEKATDEQVQDAAHRLIELGYDRLPNLAHREITSYKPKSVIDFRDRVRKELERIHNSQPQNPCTLANFTANELLAELLKRWKG